jgi:hypothetical protein
MSKVSWVKYKKMGGPRCMGEVGYNPTEPWGPWTRIMGVVARSEGNIDTTVMYDETGVTWGFLQWTFKSGRLQKLLESFKAIPSFDMEQEDGVHSTLFEDVCCDSEGKQLFEKFGFMINSGKFIDTETYKPLDPAIKKQQKRIVDICMGRTRYKSFKNQKQHAMDLARLFVSIGHICGVADAQVQFAKAEFKRGMEYRRPPLGNIDTIGDLLNNTWDTPAPALFLNLWQNHPGAAYRLFKKVYLYDVKNTSDYGGMFFEEAWKRACKSKFGNWGFGKPENKTPRVTRIKKAMKEFYGINLKLYK